ncbi:MAG: SRPBCC domain-containing protein [Armatimonadota bacterium]
MSYTPQPSVTVERVFAAPKSLVWDAMTQGEHLGRWFAAPCMQPGPNTMDFREGGVFHFSMIGDGGFKIWGRWLFRQIREHSFYTHHHSSSDEGGGVIHHPMAPDWPLEFLTRTEFDEVEGGTRVRLSWTALGSDTNALKLFEEGIPSMEQGWSGTFDYLETFLEGTRNV